MELFLAIQIQPDRKLRNIYFQIKRLFKKQRVKFYPFEEFFVILRYLPQTEIDFISDINRIIAEQVSQVSPFSIEIEGVDIYPYKILPKVLWFRLSQNQKLMNLAQKIDAQITSFGYKPENFAFYPHITFARIRKLYDTEPLDIIEQKFGSFEPIEFPVDQIILFQSIRTQGPSVYKVRNRFKIND